MKNFKDTILPAILNSYSVMFFLNNRWMAIATLLATMLNFWAGLSGLLAVIMTVMAAYSLGFDKVQLRNGVLSFNALITGIGLGTFFDPGVVFFVLLALSSLLTLILSVSLGGWLFKYGLPFLSIPFVMTFWLILLPYSMYENLGLTHRNIFWINEMYAIGGSPLIDLYQKIDSWEINKLLDIYLRSLSSIFFQNNLISGIIIALALLFSSRIYFSLSILGFLSAYIFALFSGSDTQAITYYNIGANFMMVAFSIGGFFIIPSKHSYFWTVLLVPITSLVLIFFLKLFGYVQLPVFSLPYAMVTIFFVHFLKQRSKEKNLILTPVQHYSPETNLYAWLNNSERLSRFLYFPFQLPFWGEWQVTQGYHGEFTHKEPWGHALDFMILDDEGKSYTNSGFLCEDYYCFGKPVTAPADGIVIDFTDHIDDNEIGQVNTIHNWGNSLIIQHIPGVYSQLSHLKKDSVRVKRGTYVKMGDIVAQCGNSGRSPYPHLHFQVQNNPLIGSKTLFYPVSYYFNSLQNKIIQFNVPVTGEKVSNLNQHHFLFQAMNILPDTVLEFSWTDEKGKQRTEHWESYTDAMNYKYLLSRETDAVAYFTCDQMMFYFTAFYGERNSLLYHFFLSAYKIMLTLSDIPVYDKIPVHLLNNNKLMIRLNDFSAPFYNFAKADYHQEINNNDHTVDPKGIDIKTEIITSVFGKKSVYLQSEIHFNEKGIESFSVAYPNKKIYAKSIR
jgi:urea transporter